jgi:hypothetical protein
MYIHIYNLYSILKTFEHDVILLTRLHLVSPALFPSRHGFKPHLLHYFFLKFYAVLIKWAGLAQSASRNDMPGSELWLAGVWPVLDCRLVIYRRASEGLFVKK